MFSKNKRDQYKINLAQSSHIGPCVWVVVTVYRASALCLYSDIFSYLGHFWKGNGCISPANDSMQIRLGVDKT